MPPAFILEAVLRLAATAFYFFLITKNSYNRVMMFTTVVYGATLAGLWFSLRLEMSGSLTLFYAVERVAFKLIMLHWGVYVVDFFTVGESSTAFPFVYSAQPLGSVMAGIVLALNPLADLSHLFLVCAALIVLSLVIGRRAIAVRKESPRINVLAPGEGGKGLAQAVRRKAGGMRAGFGAASWRYVFRAPVVRYMALATAALVLVRTLLQICGAQVLEGMFSSAQEIGRFLGYYKISSNVLVFVLQALLAARLMKRFSPTRVNFSYALLALAGFAALFLFPGTSSLVFAESVRKEWKSILKTPFSVMVYGSMADYARAPSRIAIFGVVVPLAGILSGLVIMGLSWLDVSLADLAVPGAVIAVGFIVVTLLQNRAYKLALVELLQNKLDVSWKPGQTSSVMRGPDARILDIRAARKKTDYLLVRYELGRRLFPDLYRTMGDPDSMDNGRLVELLEEVLLLVELYRPRGAPQLRSLLAGALQDRREDLRDNAEEVIASLLPPALSRRARLLLTAGLHRGVELSA